MVKNRNEKGFTLVELLAVIVILALIALITVPIINGTINSSKERLEKEQYERVEQAVKTYTAKNVSDDCACVSIDDLKQDGYLENVVIRNPKTGDAIDGIYTIIWSEETNQYEYHGPSSACSCS